MLAAVIHDYVISKIAEYHEITHFTVFKDNSITFNYLQDGVYYCQLSIHINATLWVCGWRCRPVFTFNRQLDYADPLVFDILDEIIKDWLKHAATKLPR